MAEASLITPITVQVMGLTVHGQYSTLMTIFINRVIKEIIKRTMKITAALFLTTSVIFASNSYAQLGGLLKDLKTLSDKANQNANTPANSASTNSQTNNSSPNNAGRMNSELFCEKLKSIPSAKIYASNVDKFMSLYNYDEQRYPEFIYQGLDNDQYDLAKFLNQRIPEQLRSNFDFYERYLGYFGDCAATLKDDKLIYSILPGVNNLNSFYSLSNTKDRVDFLKKHFGDPSDVFRMILPSMFSAVKFREPVAFSDFRSYKSRYWITLFTIAGKDSESIIEQIANSNISKIEKNILAKSELVENAKIRDKEYRERQEQERIQQAEARKLKEAKAKEYVQKFMDFSGSPEGKLTLSYQYFQVLQICSESRKGYALQLINESEFSDAKKKIKQIEDKIKPELKNKSTDSLWANATARNQKFDPIEGSIMMGNGDSGVRLDVLATVARNATSDFTSAKQDCTHFHQLFKSQHELIFGKETPKKNF